MTDETNTSTHNENGSTKTSKVHYYKATNGSESSSLGGSECASIGRASGSGLGSTNSSQACAACKHQRRRCAPDCPLASYFPAHLQKQFLNAHRLFGVNNMVKVIKNMSKADKDNAMKTMIYQANVRAIDPVGGCYRVVKELQQSISICSTELMLVQSQLDACRAIRDEMMKMKNLDIAGDVNDNTSTNMEYDWIRSRLISDSLSLPDSSEGKQYLLENVRPTFNNFGDKEVVPFAPQQQSAPSGYNDDGNEYIHTVQLKSENNSTQIRDMG